MAISLCLGASMAGADKEKLQPRGCSFSLSALNRKMGWQLVGG